MDFKGACNSARIYINFLNQILMLKVELIGNLGADAEVKESNGSKFITMRIASTTKIKKDDGSSVEHTDWIDATINDAESKVLPYLRQGVKVFVRGNARMRVYSSPKDKCMKAGLSVLVAEIELLSAQPDDVPRQLVNPETGALISVTKYFWAETDTKGMKREDTRLLIDTKGNEFSMDSRGFVTPVRQPNEPEDTDGKS